MKYRSVKCPDCKTTDIEKIDYRGIKCIVCNVCGYDERQIYDEFPVFRSSQREKSRYSPYRSGRKVYP